MPRPSSLVPFRLAPPLSGTLQGTMTASELRDKYLRFFESKGHTRHPSGLLIPYDVTGKLDESLLFNGAGMVQFKPYFRGVATPENKRLANAQKCVRTGDIDEVGDLSHLTFFEMMGNFSFGDYFKKEAIDYSWEFLTSAEWLGLDVHRLAFTIFEEDDEAYGYWAEHFSSIGIDPATRIFRLGEETNYWPAGAFSSGPPGPCGPNSEMFFWTPNDEPAPTGPYTREDYLRDEKAGKWLEIWNDVFIQYEWKGSLRDPSNPSKGYEKEGLDPLPFRSIDTGMGLERTAAVLGGHSSVYDIDIFQPILRAIEAVKSGRDGSSLHSSTVEPTVPPLKYGDDPEKDKAIRIIADHIRTACFCIADGVLPSNTGRGYVLRRLIRRAVLKGQRVLGFEEPFFHKVFEGVLEVMGHHYTELYERREIIVETLQNEENQFRRTVSQGYNELLNQLRFLVASDSTGSGGCLVTLKYLLNKDNELPLPSNPELVTLLNHLPTRNDREARFETYLNYSNLEAETLSTPSLVSHFLDCIKRHYESLIQSRRVSLELTQAYDYVKQLVMPGNIAFRLYDTYGFPLEVTTELCAEAGIGIDLDGYEQAMREAQERSRGASDMDTVYGGYDEELVLSISDAVNLQTDFIGYDTFKAECKVAQISPRFGPDGVTTADLQVCLDQTPFYAESGGQVGDTGTISCDDFELKVVKTWKEMGLVWHDVEMVRGPHVQGLDKDGALSILNSGVFFKTVVAEVDKERRKAITRNHTATHLLHAALRNVLGKHVTQAGSLVHPDHLRFDFTHGKGMTPKEIAEVEKIVNQQILNDRGVVIHSDLAIDDAKKMGAMALFGEKYGDRVRMIEVEGFSKELCGGCHVNRSGEIGLFKITSESSAASGVRRIEAITGTGAYQWVNDQQATLRKIADLLKTPGADLVASVEKTLETLREEKKKREKAEAAMVRGGGSTKEEKADAFETVGAIKLWTKRFDSIDPKIVASAVDDNVANNPGLVAVAAIVNEGKVNLVCKVGAEAVKNGAHAGNIVREVAKMVGGGGGGRPDFATAGGKDPSMVDAALASVKGLLG